MAKLRRYRKYNKSTRWSANLRNLSNKTIDADPQSQFQSNMTLCSNPPQNVNMVTTVYTIKNIEFNGNITITYTDSTANSIDDITAYIMYVPQGMVVGPDYASEHPEYILAMKYYGKPSFPNNTTSFQNPLRVKTRLARKLQSGDSIILYIRGININTQFAYQLSYSGVTRWWTKSN